MPPVVEHECSSCEKTLPNSSFSKSQRRKGVNRVCKQCVESEMAEFKNDISSTGGTTSRHTRNITLSEPPLDKRVLSYVYSPIKEREKGNDNGNSNSSSHTDSRATVNTPEIGLVLSVSCKSLVQMDWVSKSDPMVMLYAKKPSASSASASLPDHLSALRLKVSDEDHGAFQNHYIIGYTEGMKDEHNPQFNVQIRVPTAVLRESPATDLVVAVYDLDVDDAGPVRAKLHAAAGAGQGVTRRWKLELIGSAAMQGCELLSMLTESADTGTRSCSFLLANPKKKISRALQKQQSQVILSAASDTSSISASPPMPSPSTLKSHSQSELSPLKPFTTPQKAHAYSDDLLCKGAGEVGTGGANARRAIINTPAREFLAKSSFKRVSTSASPPSSPSKAVPVYHEKQSLQMCAMHALNCLFQHRFFSKRDLDAICDVFDPPVSCWKFWHSNPHRSPYGTGNYDVNVIMSAVQSKRVQWATGLQLEAAWFDKRKSVERINLNHVYGFIINLPLEVQARCCKKASVSQHWVTVRRVNGVWYNLDSRYRPLPITRASTSAPPPPSSSPSSPSSLSSLSSSASAPILAFLSKVLSNPRAHLLIVSAYEAQDLYYEENKPALSFKNHNLSKGRSGNGKKPLSAARLRLQQKQSEIERLLSRPLYSRKNGDDSDGGAHGHYDEDASTPSCLTSAFIRAMCFLLACMYAFLGISTLQFFLVSIDVRWDDQLVVDPSSIAAGVLEHLQSLYQTVPVAVLEMSQSVQAFPLSTTVASVSSSLSSMSVDYIVEQSHVYAHHVQDSCMGAVSSTVWAMENNDEAYSAYVQPVINQYIQPAVVQVMPVVGMILHSRRQQALLAMLVFVCVHCLRTLCLSLLYWEWGDTLLCCCLNRTPKERRPRSKTYLLSACLHFLQAVSTPLMMFVAFDMASVFQTKSGFFVVTDEVLYITTAVLILASLIPLANQVLSRCCSGKKVVSPSPSSPPPSFSSSSAVPAVVWSESSPSSLENVGIFISEMLFALSCLILGVLAWHRMRQDLLIFGSSALLLCLTFNNSHGVALAWEYEVEKDTHGAPASPSSASSAPPSSDADSFSSAKVAHRPRYNLGLVLVDVGRAIMVCFILLTHLQVVMPDAMSRNHYVPANAI